MATNQPTTPLSAKEIAELKSLVKLLDKELSDLDIQNLLKDSKLARTQLESLRYEAKDLGGEVGDVASIFKDIISKLKNTQVGVNDTVKAFKGLNSLVQDLQYHQQGIYELDEKGLEALSKKFEAGKLNFKNAQETLQLEEKRLESEKKLKKSQEDQVLIQLDYLQNRKKLNLLTSKEEEDLKNLEKQYDKIDKDIKGINEKLTKNALAQSEIEGIVNDTDGNYNAIEASINRANTKLEEQNNLLGLGGGLVTGLQKGLSNIGLGKLADSLGIDEAQSKMKSLSNEIIKDREKESDLRVEINKNQESLNENLTKQKQIEDEISSGSLTSEELKSKQDLLSSLKEEHTERSNILSQNKVELGNLSEKNAKFSGMKGQFKVLTEGAKAFGESLKKSLGPAALIAMAIEEIINAMKIIDSGAGDMAKSMNMTYSEALKTREELGTIADLSGDAAVQTKDLQESLMAVNKALGSNARLNEADLVTMTKLTKQAGFTHDELMGIQKLSLVNGKKLEDNTKEVLGSAKAHASMRGLMINEKDVLREVNKMSASLKLSLGGSADKMAEAVVKTKALGLSIEQAEKMADGLLQFESSISSEMEAEMLTGKALNFEKARLLALNNDVAGAAEEIAKQVGSSADFTKMNRIQQEALAKAAGMTRDELAQSLMDREALQALSGVEGKTAKERFDTLVRTVGMEEAKKRLGNEELARQYEQQSVQERFQQTVEKLKEVFVRIAEPLMGILDPIMEIVETIMPLVNVLLFPLMAQIKAVGKYISTWISEPFKAIKEVIGGIIDIFSGDFSQGLEKLGKGLLRAILTPVQAIMNAGISVINSAISLANKVPGVNIGEIKEFNLADSIMGDDVVSKAGYGKRTLLGPDGAIKLNNNDTVIAGTKLLDDPNKQFQQPSIEAPQSSSIFSKILQSITAPISMMSEGAQSILGSVLPSTSDESSSILLDVKDILVSIYDVISKGISPEVIEKVKTSESSSLATNVNKQTDTLTTNSNKISATADFTQMNRIQQEALATVDSTTDKSKDSSAFTSFKETLFKINPILGLASKLFSTEDKSKEITDKSNDSSLFTSFKETLFKLSPALNLASKLFSSEDKSKETTDKSKEIVSLVSSQNDKTKELSTQASTETKKESTLDKIKSTDKTKEASDKLKTEISTTDKANQLTSNNNIDVLKVNTLITETQENKDTSSSIIDKIKDIFTSGSSAFFSVTDKIKESVSSALSTSSESKDSSIFTSVKDTLLKLNPILGLASKLFSTENVTDKSKENISSLTSSLSSSTDKTKSNDLTKNINISNIDNASKIDAKSIDKSNVSNLNTLASSSINEAVKSTETNKTSSLNAVNALNKADLSNLIVNAENVSVVKSKTSEENKSSILDIFNPIKMISTITDLFTNKSETETNKNNLAKSSLNENNLINYILGIDTDTKNIASTTTAKTTDLTTSALTETETNKTDKTAESINSSITSLDKKLKTSTDKTKSSLLALTNVDNVQSVKNTDESKLNKLEEELLTSGKVNELASTSIDNLKVANLIIEKQQTEEKGITSETVSGTAKGALTGAAIGGLIGGPLGMLAGGLLGGVTGGLFGENKEEITPINNEIQPLGQTLSPSNVVNNINTSNTTNNDQNVTSDENVVRILQEAVTVLKAIQSKDTNVQLAIDGDVIAKKITSNVSREQVKNYSSIS